MSAPVPKRDIGGAVSRYSTVLKRANTQLNGDSEASSRFWALEERLNRDKLSSGVIANDIRRSTMHREIANLLIDSVITLDDLDGFTEDIKSYAQHWIGQ